MTLAVLLSLAAAGFPHASMWSDAREATLVANVTVESAYGAVAHLHVKEVWKGPNLESVDVRYDSTTICPSPELYEVGSELVVFLDPYSDKETFTDFAVNSERRSTRTWVGSHDKRLIRDEVERSALKASVLRALSTSKSDWAMAAFAAPATRGDGASAFGAIPDPVFSRVVSAPTSSALTPAMLDQLERAFIRTPTHDVTLVWSMALLRTQRSKRLDHAFAKAIDRAEGDVFAMAVEFYEERVEPLVRTELTPDQALEAWSQRRSPGGLARAKQRWSGRRK